MTNTSPLKHLTAAVVSAALIVLSPGIASYEAAAQFVVGGAGRAVSVVPGGQAGAVRTAPVTLSPAPLPTSLSLPGTLPVLPSVLPSLRPAVAPAASALAVPAAAVPAAAPRAASAVPAAAKAMTPAAAPSEATSAPSFRNLLAAPRTVALPVAEIAAMPGGQARDAGASMMDAILGLKASPAASADPVPADSSLGTVRRAALSVPTSRPFAGRSVPLNGVADPAPQGAVSKALGAVKAVALMAVSGAAVYGAHLAAAALLPAVFGTVPVVAVWAVSSGVLLLPMALWARYRLALRDSPRLSGVKTSLDLLTGAFLGAVAVAVPQVMGGALLATPLVGLAALGGFAALGAAAAGKDGGTGGIFGAIAAWGALNLIAPLLGTAAASTLTLGGVLGLMALPAMTTISFFLGRIVASAESGRPFAVPGSMQQIRFPAYTWVMTGVVFALLTGYGAVWTNVAFGIWMFLGNTRLFNILFAGAAVWAAATGFAAPITFLVLAFAPERAAMATEWLLGKLLPKGDPAPSTKAEPIKLAEEGSGDGRWPQFHYWAKTALAIGSLLALGGVMSATVFGLKTFLSNLGVAAAMSIIPLIFSKKLIKLVMKAEPMDEAKDPEVFGIMRELRERINAGRAAKGDKPIPMPEMVNVPMPVPNAFATGFSPFSAMVGVTNEMKDMTLNPERTRAGLIRLMYVSEANSKQFRVFRRAIRGSIAGIPEGAGPQEIVLALRNADQASLKALGVRTLRGVMGHEFEHVMHRDMILGSIAGTIASGISYASYGVLWGVGHAQALFARLWARLTGKGKDVKAAPKYYDGPRSNASGTDVLDAGSPVRPEAFEPASAAVAAQSLIGLVKIFAALWGPVLATILSMASSRTREGHADEGGAILTEDPEALALGLGMLVTWQMPAGFTLRRELLPIIASQAHVMTVNPLEQLRNAGQLPKLDAVTSALVGKEDDFFFNLFITHPDTMQRIERLYEMAEALAARLRGQPPPGPTTRPPGSLRAAAGRRVSEGVDPDTLAALSVPGLDGRLEQVVEAFAARSAARGLGHLPWALGELLAQGGVVRYADAGLGEDAPLAFFDPALKAVYLDAALLRVDPDLQGAALAGLFQQVHDWLDARVLDSAESRARSVLAQDAYLEGFAMDALAHRIDLSNPVEKVLYEGVVANRLAAAAGFRAAAATAGEWPTLGQLAAKARSELALLERRRAEFTDELGLVRGGLAAAPGDSRLARQERLLSEKLRILEGSLLLTRAQAAAAEREAGEPDAEARATALASRLDGYPAPASFGPLVPVTQRPTVDPDLAPALTLLRQAIKDAKDPAVRRLKYLLTALDAVLERGGRVLYAAPGEGAAAYFSPVTLDLVVGREFKNARPELVAALLVHELTHAADYLGVPRPGERAWRPRPMTRETERNAFTNEAIFAGAFDPAELAGLLDRRNPSELAAYSLVYHARARWLEGKTSLEAMVSDAYTQLFGAHFEGLQTAAQLYEEVEHRKLAPVLESIEELGRRVVLLEGALARGESHRAAQLESAGRSLALYESLRTLHRRELELLGQAEQAEEDDAPAGPPSERSFLFWGPRPV
ncbi:MAG: M48 family metalloprotease [Elusimicrobia bacterium]|nr:M48 family metalloprotease [Elusimicrobiota bacterium]